MLYNSYSKQISSTFVVTKEENHKDSFIEVEICLLLTLSGTDPIERTVDVNLSIEDEANGSYIIIMLVCYFISQNWESLK